MDAITSTGNINEHTGFLHSRKGISIEHVPRLSIQWTSHKYEIAPLQQFVKRDKYCAQAAPYIEYYAQIVDSITFTVMEMEKHVDQTYLRAFHDDQCIEEHQHRILWGV